MSVSLRKIMKNKNECREFIYILYIYLYEYMYINIHNIVENEEACAYFSCVYRKLLLHM